MNSLFNTTYPIFCAAMNKVSDAKLASAVWESGCMPSLTLFNYIINRKIHYNLMQHDIDTFYTLSPLGKFVFSVDSKTLTSNEFFQMIVNNKIEYLEIIVPTLQVKHTKLTEDTIKVLTTLQQDLKRYKDLNIKVILKGLTRFVPLEIELHFPNLFDGFILKGPDGAGSVVDRLDNSTLLENQISVLQKYPNCCLITTGGISTGKEAKQYLDNGASYVGIGTLFAFSEESSISNDSKLAAIGKQIERFVDTNQNAIIFSTDKFEEFDRNHTVSLEHGVKSVKGHLFAGAGITNITCIKTVKEIVEEIINDM
jgi:NAD(P)H-dependent flavin oxidoreductase YrpB (nitropropane dioxygenase family)